LPARVSSPPMRARAAHMDIRAGGGGGGEARSIERAARNQVRFREANEGIDRRRQELGVEGERFPLLCECDRERCTELFQVRPVEYETARENERRFLVVEGHDGGARVIGRHDGFVIIEKDGREGELVQELVSE
jgi:hypothetical protein